MSDPTHAENEPKAEFQKELNAFAELITLLASHEISLSLSERGALAYIVESHRKNFGEEWLQAFDVFLGELAERLGEKGKHGGVAWLAKEFNDRYDHTLKNEIQKEVDPTRKNNLNLLQNRIKDNWLIREKAILNQEVIPIGSVAGEHKPLWYQYV